MKPLSYKYKIIIASVVFVAFAAGMFGYGYTLLEGRNQRLSDAALESQTQYELLKVEQRSFEQGQKDIATLAQKPVPPEELFSRDTKVVKEIKTLEDIAAQNNVEFALAISGTSKTAVQATGTASEIFVVPYTATITGSFDGIMKYMQKAEHLPFATHMNLVTLTAQEDGDLRAQLNSEFYIKK